MASFIAKAGSPPYKSAANNVREDLNRLPPRFTIYFMGSYIA